MKDNLTEGILLSGGLDTSILAAIATKFFHPKTVTVGLEGAPAPDIEYATLIARKLGLEQIVHIFNEKQLYETIPIVVKTTKSFDPMEIRNSVPIYIALKAAKENGMRTIMTGDGCDELLAGYSFLFRLDKEEVDLELRKLSSTMAFSSMALADVLDIRVRLPYLDPEFRALASSLDSRYKIAAKQGQMYGKWILRKAYEETLPAEIIWRTKAPIEQGSGTTTLPDLLNQKISDNEFSEKRRKYLAEDRVTIRDKEQLLYYEVYKGVVGRPHVTGAEGKTCPGCGSNVSRVATYCRTCGAYPL